MAAYEYTGLDPDNLDEYRVQAITEQMQAAIGQLDARITAWWIIDKRRDYSYFDSNFRNETARQLDEVYSQQFREGERFTLRYRVFFLYSGYSGAFKFMDTVQRIQSEKACAVLTAIVGAVRESFSGRRAIVRSSGDLQEMVDTFERLLHSFTHTAPLTFNRLTGDDYLAALAGLLNRASDNVTATKPHGVPIDSWAPTDYIESGKNLTRFRGNTRDTYMAVLGVKKWPPATSPMLFETLCKLPMEVTICQIVRYLDSEQSESAINKFIEYYKLTLFNPAEHAIAKLANSEPTPRPEKAELLNLVEGARQRIMTEDMTYAYHNLSVFVYGEDMRTVTRNVSLMERTLANMRFGVVREQMNALPSFGAMLPGQWALQTRYELMSAENVADCAPIYTMGEGERIHDTFSTKVFGREVPAFAVFGNTYGGRTYFSPHLFDVGHMLIIAPTRSGKSTFINFLMSQFLRYGDVNIYVFDRKLSCKIVTELHDGAHVDLKSSTARWNPCSVLMSGAEDGQLWLREWILMRLAEGGYTATPEDRLKIDEALVSVQEEYRRSKLPIRLSSICMHLTTHLELQLREWLSDGPYGMFDCEEDDFTFLKKGIAGPGTLLEEDDERPNWTTMEMRDILAVERLARAFLDYAFRKIYDSLDGRPTLIYLEEASFLVNDPKFSKMIDDWLKTLGSKNAFVWLTMQSPESITNSEMAATMIDNIFSFLLLYNEKTDLHRDKYKSNFGFTDQQVDLIKSLVPRRDYLLIKGGEARVMQAAFNPETLAFLRSEVKAMNLFEQHKASNVPNWKQNYLDEVQAMR